MAEFIYYARRLILSLDSSDGGDLIRASGQPKKLQFGAFEILSPTTSPDSISLFSGLQDPSRSRQALDTILPPQARSPLQPLTHIHSDVQTTQSSHSNLQTKIDHREQEREQSQEKKRTIAIVLWGQTCDRAEKELRVTEYLKKQLLVLADRGANGGSMVVCGVAWRITALDGVVSSDEVGSAVSSLV